MPRPPPRSLVASRSSLARFGIRARRCCSLARARLGCAAASLPSFARAPEPGPLAATRTSCPRAPSSSFRSARTEGPRARTRAGDAHGTPRRPTTLRPSTPDQLSASALAPWLDPDAPSYVCASSCSSSPTGTVETSRTRVSLENEGRRGWLGPGGTDAMSGGATRSNAASETCAGGRRSSECGTPSAAGRPAPRPRRAAPGDGPYQTRPRALSRLSSCALRARVCDRARRFRFAARASRPGRFERRSCEGPSRFPHVRCSRSTKLFVLVRRSDTLCPKLEPERAERASCDGRAAGLRV